MSTSGVQVNRYRLYIDESGDHTYKLLDDPGHRYLALLGVWFQQGTPYTSFADDLDHFKREFFGARPDKPVVLHRSDIINRKGPFGVLCQQEVRERFNERLLGLVAKAEFRMTCVVIDKQAQMRYPSPFHPYHTCLALMLERYSRWLNGKNAIGDVMAEARGREENLQLEGAYRRVYESGTRLYDHQHHQQALTSKDIKIRPKIANIAGLQLADILAHPVKQACISKNGGITQREGVFGRKLYGCAKQKFNCHERNGKIDGYGTVFL